MGPIWATRIWANPYGTHAEPGCTAHMGSRYGTHIGIRLLVMKKFVTSKIFITYVMLEQPALSSPSR